MTEGLVTGQLTDEEIKQFEKSGYFVVKGLLTSEEVKEIKEHFMELHAGGPIPGCFKPLSPEEADGDILKLYPRMMFPSRVDDLTFSYMLHPRVLGILADLFNDEPLAVQDMFYFKPPGARGQALHQDNFFLKVKPGTCIAAWIAIDPTDEENGCLRVVPHTNMMDLQCAKESDRTDLYAYPKEVEVPEGMEAVPVNMNAGDVLFFNGNLIHGSLPNLSEHRFRRSLIFHYADASTTHIGGTKRLVRRDGTVVPTKFNTDEGPCGGEFVENKS